MSDDNVIDLPVSGEIDATPEKPGYPCRHLYMKKLVNIEKRIVTCSGCKEEILPIEVLIEMADSKRADRRISRQLRAECDKAFERLEELKKDERRVKSRIRNAQKKKPVVEERVRLLNAIDGAMQQFCDGLFPSRDYAWSHGVLEGFDVVVRGLFKRGDSKNEAIRLSRRIDAAKAEVTERRKRRGDKPGDSSR